jgi:WD repeat and SOF domain-containing protein 1
MQHCDFTTHKYVRDCLEVLRVGAGLDNGNHFRRGKIDSWKYIYSEEKRPEDTPVSWTNPSVSAPLVAPTDDPARRKGNEPPIQLATPRPSRPYSTLPEPCDPAHPRIYHMFWAGPFTDKPYMTLISFLFTQSLGLDKPLNSPAPANVCQPQFWVWVNPGPASVLPPPTALQDMYDLIGDSPWSAPFLHPRFKDVVKFKLWNTTEQLDSIDEIKDEWRHLKGNILNSGGWKYAMKTEAEPQSTSSSSTGKKEKESLSIPIGNGTNGPIPLAHEPTGQPKPSGPEDKYEHLGSTSKEDYDNQGKLSVVLSDMARFILCHRFGGTYLDADTLLLRDWEELFNWRGAFAYRWSRLEKFNTAVLRMNKGSALGSWLFRTALRNGLDFHPMTVSMYTKDADLDGLFLRLPDALFDPAWLVTEYYQRDRPPFPYFQSFHDLFRTPSTDGAAPQSVGFDGFFRGAFSYHWHNHWWEPFDPARNFPDLGSRFHKNEHNARVKLHSASIADASSASAAAARTARPKRGGWKFRKAKDAPVTGVAGAAPPPGIEYDLYGVPKFEEDSENEDVLIDWRDLSWAAVLKRTFEAYLRGERPNMYGEWIHW